jgi:hypothetical protein
MESPAMKEPAIAHVAIPRSVRRGRPKECVWSTLTPGKTSGTEHPPQHVALQFGASDGPSPRLFLRVRLVLPLLDARHWSIGRERTERGVLQFHEPTAHLVLSSHAGPYDGFFCRAFP